MQRCRATPAPDTTGFIATIVFPRELDEPTLRGLVLAMFSSRRSRSLLFGRVFWEPEGGCALSYGRESTKDLPVQFHADRNRVSLHLPRNEPAILLRIAEGTSALLKSEVELWGETDMIARINAA